MIGKYIIYDVGLSDVISNWKEECVFSDRFNAITTCNKKLIGAEYFISDALLLTNLCRAYYVSPRDKKSGTHCVLAAIGSLVQNVNFFGIAKETARGMMSKVRLSVCKVCWLRHDNGQICSPYDIMTTMEVVLKNYVHIIFVSSVSYTFSMIDFVNDFIVISSFGTFNMLCLWLAQWEMAGHWKTR